MRRVIGTAALLTVTAVVGCSGSEEPAPEEASEKDMEDLRVELREAVKARGVLRRKMEAEKARSVLEPLGIKLPTEFSGTRLTTEVSADEASKLIASHRADAKGVTGLRLSYTEAPDPGMTSALDSVRLGDVAFPLDLDGDGVGVWWHDGPDSHYQSGQCAVGDVTLQDPGETPREHASWTFCILRAAAPEAHIHVAEPTNTTCGSRSDVDTFTSPPVYVSTLSDGYQDPLDNDYGTCERNWDNFVEDTRIAHFALTHNQGSFVRGSAQAYNVMAVGSYNDNANPDVNSDFSNWRDPETGADKPDIVAPGEDIDIPVSSNQRNSGTSFSTPLAAGFAASLIEGNTFLQYRPHLLRATLMAGAVSVDPGISKDGQGRLDFWNSYYNGWYWWHEAPAATVFSGDFDSDGKPDVGRTFWLEAGRTYTVAIAWLVDGTYVLANNEPNIKVRLRIASPTGELWHEYKTRETYQKQTFTTTTTGIYVVTIEQEANPNNDDVAIGMRLTW